VLWRWARKKKWTRRCCSHGKVAWVVGMMRMACGWKTMTKKGATLEAMVGMVLAAAAVIPWLLDKGPLALRVSGDSVPYGA